MSCLLKEELRSTLGELTEKVEKFIEKISSVGFRDRLTTKEDIEEANMLIDEVLRQEIDPSLIADPYKEDVYAIVAIALGHENYDYALSALEELLLSYPHDLEISCRYLHILKQNNSLVDQASEKISRFLRFYPQSAAAQYIYAILRRAEGNYKEAVLSLNRAIELLPDQENMDLLLEKLLLLEAILKNQSIRLEGLFKELSAAIYRLVAISILKECDAITWLCNVVIAEVIAYRGDYKEASKKLDVILNPQRLDFIKMSDYPDKEIILRHQNAAYNLRADINLKFAEDLLVKLELKWIRQVDFREEIKPAEDLLEKATEDLNSIMLSPAFYVNLRALIENQETHKALKDKIAALLNRSSEQINFGSIRENTLKGLYSQIAEVLDKNGRRHFDLAELNNCIISELKEIEALGRIEQMSDYPQRWFFWGFR